MVVMGLAWEQGRGKEEVEIEIVVTVIVMEMEAKKLSIHETMRVRNCGAGRTTGPMER